MIASARVLLALILLTALYWLIYIVIDLYVWVIVGSIGGSGDILSGGMPEYQYNPADPDRPFIAALMAIGSLSFLRVIVRAVGASVSIKPRPDSIPVSPEQAPQLWATVRELAERVDTPAPAEIRLVTEANASVTQNVGLPGLLGLLGLLVGTPLDPLGVLVGPLLGLLVGMLLGPLGLLPRRKRMYIGVPLLVGMPPEELRAVLCHELGHYTRKHVQFGALAYRGSAQLAAAQAEIQQVKSINRLTRFCAALLYAPLSGYARLYDRLTFAVRRRQELEADDVAAAVTGTVVTAEALRSAHVLPTLWEDFLAQYVEPTRKATGVVPEELFLAFQAMLDDPDFHNILVDKRRQPQERPRSPHDSHPSLAERLARLERCPVSTERSESGSVTEPFGAADSLFRDLCETMPTYHEADKLPWKEWFCRLAQFRATMPLEPLRRAVTVCVRWRGDAIPALTLDTVLNLLEAGKSTELATALGSYRHLPEDSVQDPLRHLVDAVYALVGQALVNNRTARWLVDWTGPSRLVPRDTNPDEIYQWVDGAVYHPTRVSGLRRQLTSLGLNLTTPVLEAKSATGNTITIDVDEATRKTVDRFSPVMVGMSLMIIVVFLSRSQGDFQRDDYASPLIGVTLLCAAGWTGARRTVPGRRRRP
ncbi:MAG: M48 family metallopeptidase [Pseudonocardiaceae bacterium]